MKINIIGQKLLNNEYIEICLNKLLHFKNDFAIISTLSSSKKGVSPDYGLMPFLSFKGGIYFTIVAVMLFLTRIFIGKVADQKGEAIFVYTCHMCMFIALFLIAFIAHNITFLLSAALSDYAFGGIEPTLQSMAVSIAPPQRRGATNSTFLCAYDMGIGLGGGIAGVLIDMIGYNYMFAIIAIANILSILIYIAIGKKHPSSLTYRLKMQKEKQA